MKTTPIAKLKAQYEAICNEYVQKFANKQGLEFDKDAWVGGTVGGIVCLSDYFFDLADIVLDINTRQPKGLILKWQNDSIEAHMENPFTENINYYSYSKGLRYSDLKD